MPRRLTDKRWLDQLLDEELLRHDPDQARARLPADVRAIGASPLDLAPAASLLVTRSLRRRITVPPPRGRGGSERVGRGRVPRRDPHAHRARARPRPAARGPVRQGAPPRRDRRRARRPRPGEHAARDRGGAGAAGRRQRAGGRAGAARRGGGAPRPVLPSRRSRARALPLHAGKVAVLRRRLARVVMRLPPRRPARAPPRSRAMAPTPSARRCSSPRRSPGSSPPPAATTSAPARSASGRSARLGLGRADDPRGAPRGRCAPRGPDAIAEAAPERVRGFLLEQLRLAQLGLKLVDEAPAAWVEAFARAAALDPQAIAAAEIEAAAQHADHAELARGSRRRRRPGLAEARRRSRRRHGRGRGARLHRGDGQPRRARHGDPRDRRARPAPRQGRGGGAPSPRTRSAR